MRKISPFHHPDFHPESFAANVSGEGKAPLSLEQLHLIVDSCQNQLNGPLLLQDWQQALLLRAARELLAAHESATPTPGA